MGPAQYLLNCLVSYHGQTHTTYRLSEIVLVVFDASTMIADCDVLQVTLLPIQGGNFFAGGSVRGIQAQSLWVEVGHQLLFIAD